MFANDSYKPTYTGPFLATGEQMRRARNNARASGDSRAVARTMRPMRRGVQAGSLASMLTGDMASDATRMQGINQANQTYNQMVQQNAANNLGFNQARINEFLGLQRLLREQDQLDMNVRASDADREADAQIFNRQLAAQREQDDRARRDARRRVLINALTGGALIGGIGLGGNAGRAMAGAGLLGSLYR